jgi:hypothetical protein
MKLDNVSYIYVIPSKKVFNFETFLPAWQKKIYYNERLLLSIYAFLLKLDTSFMFYVLHTIPDNANQN